MRILIVDDEELARLRLRTLVESLAEDDVEIVGEAADADSALRWLREHGADTVLLDIHMPGRDGLRLASAMKTLAPRPAVVFVTAHAEHAVRAFELDAVDYLTKPVRRERLSEALQRVRQRGGTIPGALSAPEPPALVVTERGRVLRLPLAEVLYLRAGQKYVTLRTAARAFVLDESLAELEERLGEGFLRIHRNALVARRAVRALEMRELPGEEGVGWAVRVAPVDEWLAVSRRQVVAVRLALAEGAA